MSNAALQNLKMLFQDRPEVLKMLDLRELDLSNLTDERMVEEQRKRQIYPEPVNLYATGRTRAGKSSLGNSLFGPVLPTTGYTDCTSIVQFFQMDSNLRYYDLPGAGSNEQFENINRAALLVPQMDNPDEDMIPVIELDIFDFSKNKQGEAILLEDGKKPSVEHWQSPENQNFVAPDIILYVIAPHEGVGRNDRHYLTALLKSQKKRGNQNKVIFALNIHRNADGSMKATPQNIEDAKKLITEVYQKFYHGTPPFVEINALKGTGINQITELMCHFLPSNKIGNLQQVLKDELKQFAEKERSRRYRQTLAYIASRLATYKVDQQFGAQNLLSVAYSAVSNYGIVVFKQQQIMHEAQQELLGQIDNIAAQTKTSREEVIKTIEYEYEDRNVIETRVTSKPKFEDKTISEEYTDYVEDTETKKVPTTKAGDVAGSALAGAVAAGSGIAGVVGMLSAILAAPVTAPALAAIGVASLLGATIGGGSEIGKGTKEIQEKVMKPVKKLVDRVQRELVGFEEERHDVITGTYQAVVGKREKEVGRNANHGGYAVIEDLLAIGLGMELADQSQNLRVNFISLVERGRKQVQVSLGRQKDRINQLAKIIDPEQAEAEISKILQQALLS